MENASNLNIRFAPDGSITTDDSDLNKIIRAVEEETGTKMGAAIEAVSFGEDPDEKPYLVLLAIYAETNETEDYIRDWRLMVGRQKTYDFLKDLVKNEAIDPNNSFILACEREPGDGKKKDNVVFNDSRPITVFRFLKVMFDNHKVLDDGEDFDINDFDPCHYDEGDNTILDS